MRSVLLAPADKPCDDAAVAALYTALGAAEAERSAGEWQLLDTPDLRLWKRDLLLVRRPHGLFLHRRAHLAEDDAIASLEARRLPPRLLAGWPPGELRQALRPLVKVRALLPLVKLGLVSWRARTGAVQAGVNLPAGEQPGRAWATIDAPPRRERERLAAVAALAALGWSEVGEEPVAVLADEAAAARQVREPEFPEPRQAAGEALRSALLATLNLLPALEDGIARDIDSEFLHQHRVLLRRMRSLTRALRSVFDETSAELVLAILADSARRTNRLRDLDVWLQEREAMERSLPPGLHAGLEPLYAAVAEERAAERKAVAGWLRDRARWDRLAALRLLLAGDVGRGDDHDRPLAALAAQRTWKAWRTVAKAVNGLDEDAPAETIHEVRILCKRLRYLLDACGHLTAPDDHDELRRQLRSAQEQLGEYNDAAVQQGFLIPRATAAHTPPVVAAAAGALTGMLEHRRRATLPALLAALSDLAAPLTRSRYRRLFRQAGDAG